VGGLLLLEVPGRLEGEAGYKDSGAGGEALKIEVTHVGGKEES